MFTEQITLKPVPPFNFDLSAKIFSKGNPQIRSYENGKFSQVIRLNRKLALLTLVSVGTVEKPKLLAELKSNRMLTWQIRKNQPLQQPICST